MVRVQSLENTAHVKEMKTLHSTLVQREAWYPEAVRRVQACPVESGAAWAPSSIMQSRQGVPSWECLYEVCMAWSMTPCYKPFAGSIALD